MTPKGPWPITGGMVSRAQRFWNAYARLVQKPALAFIRPQWLARKVFSLNAITTYARPRNLKVTPIKIGASTCHICQIGDTPPKGTLLYIHGGAFVIGNLRGYRHLIARLAQGAGQRGLYVDYPLAPEHPYPAALDHIAEVYAALVADKDHHPITVVGDSAGGNLALALLLRIKSMGLTQPAACALMSPVTDLAMQNPSLAANLHRDPLVPPRWGLRGVRQYLAGHDPADPTASPIHGDFAGAPPTLIQVDRGEVLYDDSRLMAHHLRKQGVDCTLTEEEGLIHVWHLNVGRSPEADRSTAEIAEFLRSHLT